LFSNLFWFRNMPTLATVPSARMAPDLAAPENCGAAAAAEGGIARSLLEVKVDVRTN
jgi:hypothetical protein